ncbi:MAG TPA: hypothetical protein VFX50_07085 [Gemmatimonadales bacterium]|nr:hypothetical protein [Gemmatimonadales bacterium]
MSRALLVFTFAGALACTAPRPDTTADAARPAPPADGARVLTPFALGEVRIGMTVAELNAALGDSLRPGYEVNETCDIVRPASFPPGVSAMVERDTIVRIDVEAAGIVTPEGAGVGDAESKVLGLYGARAAVTPHKYTGPEGHYITVTEPTDSARLTIFETDGRTVHRYRAGTVPAVQYVEGCA